jgi:hypothetical protein
MSRQIGYHCPKDILKMPKVGDNFYCSFCKENVIDLTNHTDLDVIKKIQNKSSSVCINIQKDRLNLVTNKFSSWRILILVLINFKMFFLQKLYAQNNDASTSNKSQTKKVTKNIKGQIKDGNSGRPVKKPTIEIYRGDIKLQTLKGDRKGKFALSIKSTSNYTDTISIVVSSKHYDIKKIAKIPLYKKTTSLETTLARKNSKKKKNVYVDETFTGRLLN